ncbi:MAG: hypothetical protein ACT4O1_00520 [Gemmatimonadota bacterium]
MQNLPQDHADFIVIATENRSRIVAGVVALLVIVAVLWTRSLWGFLLLGPVIAGAAATAAGSYALNDWVERRRAAYCRLAGWAGTRDGKFARYFARPVAGGSLWVWGQTEKIRDASIQCGLRIAIALYFWALMLALLIAAVYVIVALIVFALIMAAIGWFMSQSSDNDSTPSQRRSTPMDEGLLSRGKSKRFYKKTGMFSEEEFGRADNAGNLYQRTGMFSEERVGRVDDSGRVHEATGLFSEDETHRVGEDGRIYKKTGLFSEDEVGRVDADGRVYRKTGMFSEEEIGRVENDG